MELPIDPEPAPITVLVIDDEPGIRSVMNRALVRAGHACLSAAEAATGLEYARAAHPDAILLDLELPDGDGRDVIAALRRDPETADVPILMISGNVDHFRRMQALEAGAVDLVEKPFDAVMLERKLSWMVAKRRDASKN